MQFSLLYQIYPYTNAGSWLLLVLLWINKVRHFNKWGGYEKERCNQNLCGANSLHFSIQCCWYPLTQIKYVQSMRSYIRSNARTFLECISSSKGNFAVWLHCIFHIWVSWQWICNQGHILILKSTKTLVFCLFIHLLLLLL